MSQSAMPVPCRVLVPEVLPAVMPGRPAVPEFLPAPPPEFALPARLLRGCRRRGARRWPRRFRAGSGQRRERGELVRAAGPVSWDVGECARLRRFPGSVDDPRGRRGRVYPLEYMLALPLVAGMAGDGELDAAGEWVAPAPEELLLRLGAPRDRAGRARRRTPPRSAGSSAVSTSASTMTLCAPGPRPAHGQHPGLRKHLRVDGKALRGAAPRGGRAPMLLSGIWDDGATAAQLPVNIAKTSEIPSSGDLMGKIPDEELTGAVITADQMHTQREHALLIGRKGAYFVFTIGENQPGLFAAANALCLVSVAVEAWTVDRGHGRVDVRVIKTLPPTALIAALFPHVRQVFLVERYGYGPDGSLLGAVAVLGITSLPPALAGPADLLAYLRGHWAIEMHHYVRDVCLREAASHVRRAHQALAAVRNTIMGIPQPPPGPQYRRPAARLPP